VGEVSDDEVDGTDEDVGADIMFSAKKQILKNEID